MAFSVRDQLDRMIREGMDPEKRKERERLDEIEKQIEDELKDHGIE